MLTKEAERYPSRPSRTQGNGRVQQENGKVPPYLSKGRT